jgi:hypothetical protein
MLQANKKKTNIGIGLGIILEIIGRIITMYGGQAGALAGSILVLVGVVFFIWGCMNYAEGKGHSKWLGLLGLLSCIGLIILVILPDKNKELK